MSHCVALATLEPTEIYLPLSLPCLLRAGIKGVYHHGRPGFILILTFLAFILSSFGDRSQCVAPAGFGRLVLGKPPPSAIGLPSS